MFNFGHEININHKRKRNMSSKRSLKRYINYVCSDLFAEALAAQLYGENKDRGQSDMVLTAVLRVHNDFIRRISHPEPGMSTKTYFKILKEDFSKHVNELADQINALF